MRSLTPKRFVTALLVLGGVVALVFYATRSPRRPSILLITLDTTRADHLSCYADGKARTPRFDALAADGVLFLQAETAAPLTLPSHSSILTGVFPPDHGVRDNGFYKLGEEIRTVPERLSELGYRTGAFVSTVILDGKFGLKQGFEIYDDEFDEPLDVGNRFPVSRRAGETIGKAVDWLETTGEGPVFLWTHFYDPHAPYEPPPPYDRAYRGAPYDGEIAYTDLMLDRLITSARERFGDDLVIIVVADHGESFGEQGERTHGFFTYEGTSHVPLIVSGGPFRGGLRVSEPVRTVDVAATILAVAGDEPPEALRGRDLARVVSGELRDLPCYTEAWSGNSFGWSGVRSLRIGNLKLVEGPRSELHDLDQPDGESHDISRRRPADLARMTEELARLRSATGADGSLRALDDEDVAALMALGYMNAGGGSGAEVRDVVDPEKADPRDRIEEYGRVLRSRSLAGAGRWAAAAEELTAVLARDPLNASLRLERAQLLVRAGNAMAARDDLEFAAARLLTDPRAPNLLGDLARREGEAEAAEAHYREALRRSPNQYYALFHLGKLLTDSGRFEEAARTYEHVLRVGHPKSGKGKRDPRAMNNLACALIRGGLDTDRGFRLLEEAVELAPAAGDLRLSLGDALVNAGRGEEALVHLRVAQELLGERKDLRVLIERAEGE